MPSAIPLGEAKDVPQSAQQIIIKARASWLKNTDVLYILTKHKEYGLPVSTEPPQRPAGGTLYLFDKKQERYFRKDGHQWRKKANGKTVRETHEKLKVDNKDMLNCYYTHSEVQDELQRRCYWMLEQDDGIVLVHYLAGAGKTRHSGPAPGYQSAQGRQPITTGSGMGPPPQTRAPRTHFNENHLQGKRLAELQRGGSPMSGPARADDPLPLRAQYRASSLPEHASEAARELLHYNQALQAKKLAGEVIQPTAMHASAFANKPLFMAIDRQLEISQSMERLHDLATQHVAIAAREAERSSRRGEGNDDEAHVAREDSRDRRRGDFESNRDNRPRESSRNTRTGTPASKSHSPTSQVRSGSDKAEDRKEGAPRMTDTPFMDDAMESHGRVASEAATVSASDEDEGREPHPKRRRNLSVGEELSQGEVIKSFLQCNRDLLAQFKESNSVLMQHLQYQRQVDDSFRRELMEMERERARSDRETLALIASAVLGSGRLHAPSAAPRSDPVQNLQEAAAAISRFSATPSNPPAANPFTNFPFGALAQSMMLSGSWPPPGRDASR